MHYCRDRRVMETWAEVQTTETVKLDKGLAVGMLGKHRQTQECLVSLLYRQATHKSTLPLNVLHLSLSLTM